MCAAAAAEAIADAEKPDDLKGAFVAGGSALATYILDQRPGLWAWDTEESLGATSAKFNGDIDVFVWSSPTTLRVDEDLVVAYNEAFTRALLRKLGGISSKNSASKMERRRHYEDGWDDQASPFDLSDIVRTDTLKQNLLRTVKESRPREYGYTFVGYQEFRFGEESFEVNFVHFIVDEREDDTIESVISRVISSFDISVCQCAIVDDAAQTRFAYTHEFLRDVSTKTLSTSPTIFAGKYTQDALSKEEALARSAESTALVVHLLFVDFSSESLVPPPEEVMNYRLSLRDQLRRRGEFCFHSHGGRDLYYELPKMMDDLTRDLLQIKFGAKFTDMCPMDKGMCVHHFKDLTYHARRELIRVEKYIGRGFALRTRAERSWIQMMLRARSWMDTLSGLRKIAIEAPYHHKTLARRLEFTLIDDALERPHARLRNCFSSIL